MRRDISVLLLLPGLLLASPPLWTQELNDTASRGELAPRLQNVGDHHHPITVRDEMGQKFFDQGLMLAYGFNHREAGRAFTEVARRDPDAAMAYWGQALVMGPNINKPMDTEDEPRAFELVQKAMALRDKVSEREAAYIEALAQRYSGRREDRSERDRAYAEAMAGLHARYPGDLDAATLYAEALMDLRPWNYWTRDGLPFDETREVLRMLEMVRAQNPDHPGANHFYIHAVELPYPKQAEEAADRLARFTTMAGHLVHMPSHIYRRVGRYQDSIDVNLRAIAADEDYITQCRAQGFYPMAYYPHNIHFLWDAASMAGQKKLAVDAGRKAGDRITPAMLKEVPLLITFKVIPLYVYVRFGMWDAILREPAPPADQHFWTGIWYYARGMASLGRGRLQEAATELEHLNGIAAGPGVEKEEFWSPNKPAAVIQIARYALSGELAARRGDTEQAIAHLHRAVLLQDGLEYIEPPDWVYSMRQSLGAVLLNAGRPLEAEVVYWDDLKNNPENGWSLFGLMQALKARGKTEQAEAIEKRFKKAWAGSDIKLTASRL